MGCVALSCCGSVSVEGNVTKDAFETQILYHYTEKFESNCDDTRNIYLLILLNVYFTLHANSPISDCHKIRLEHNNLEDLN